MSPEALGGAGPPAGRSWHGPGSERVPLDKIFPIPTQLQSLPTPARAGNRHARSRRCRAARREEDIAYAMKSLNWYSGYRGPELARESSLTPTQQEVAARTATLVDSMVAQNAIPSQQAAFTDLLRGRQIYGDPGSAGLSVARYTSPGNVSIPTSVEGSPFLHEIMPDALDQYLCNAMERMRRSPDE